MHISKTESEKNSIHLISMESNEKQTGPKNGHAGALFSVVVIENKVENFKTKKVSPFHVKDEKHWRNNNHDGENEHLEKSGPLGMCDDPYCTTCPTYFKASQPTNPKYSNEFDPKVFSS